MIKLYGITKSRAGRTVWALEEIGVDYAQIPVDYKQQGTRTQEYLGLNPNGRIPTLVDDDLVLYESMAINHYLAELYDGGIRPQTEAARARALMWSFWCTNETEHLLRVLLRNRMALHEDDRDPAEAARVETLLKVPLSILDRHLQYHPYLVGDAFSVADINVAFGIIWLPLGGVDLSGWHGISMWVEACQARPAYRRLFGERPAFDTKDVRQKGEADPRED